MDHRDAPRAQRSSSGSPASRPAGQGSRPVPSDSAKARARARRKARQRRARNRMLVCLCALVLCVVGALGIAYGLPSGTPATVDPSSDSSAVQAGAGASDVTEATPTPEPTPDPAEERIAQVTERNIANATKDAPEVKDPDTWQQNAVALLEGLQADPEYSDLDLTVREDFPYLIAVNRAASVVTVYAADGDGDDARYTRPYMAMICSGGPDTPTGVFETPVSYSWRLLSGPCYGQYATRIWDAYLFHSVPYYTQHKDDLEYVEYNKLGTQASLGCIRLMVVDVKWIYDNCPIGTTVVIYDDENDPGPMGRPGTIYTDPDDESMRGWDPTDPAPENPWDDAYLTGTTIRSEEAWAEWDAAQDDARWSYSLTEPDLQGWSTDYKTEGTRG